VPVGGIIRWRGTVAPAGWALCDSGNGTPDLRGRFILGSGNGYAASAQRGQSTVTLSANQLPSHTHPARGSASTNFDGYNSYVDVDRGQEQARMNGCLGASCGAGWRSVAIRSLNVGVGVSVGAAGGSQPFSIMPPYYSLAYIMKLPK
jgi:microcystin-dependent protein